MLFFKGLNRAVKFWPLKGKVGNLTLKVCRFVKTGFNVSGKKVS